MGTEPHTKPAVREHRQRRADGGRALNTESRSVQSVGNSLFIGLTSYAVKTHDVECGDEPTVEVYPDGVWIDFGGEPDE